MDNHCLLGTHLHCKEENRYEIIALFQSKAKTYIGSIQCEDPLPSHWDSDTLVCEKWSDIEHSFHKDHQECKDLSIGYLCKLCYLDNLCHTDILLFELKLEKGKTYSWFYNFLLLLTYWEHSDCRDLLWNQEDICTQLCDCWQYTQLWNCKDCLQHKDWHKLCSCRPEWRDTHHQRSSLLL